MIFSTIFAEDAGPEAVQQLFSMVCVFNKTISEKGEVSAYIYKDDAVLNAMKSFQGQKLGNVILKSVTGGNDIPASAPDMLFIGNADKAADLISFCNSNSVLCMTANPDVVNSGAAIGVTVKDGKAMLLLNPQGVADQNQSFNPAIMKIAKVSK